MLVKTRCRKLNNRNWLVESTSAGLRTSLQLYGEFVDNTGTVHQIEKITKSNRSPEAPYYFAVLATVKD